MIYPLLAHFKKKNYLSDIMAITEDDLYQDLYCMIKVTPCLIILYTYNEDCRTNTVLFLYSLGPQAMSFMITILDLFHLTETLIDDLPLKNYLIHYFKQHQSTGDSQKTYSDIDLDIFYKLCLLLKLMQNIKK